MSEVKGQLYVVATPIGNMGDMSARAIEVLNEVALIVAEDTRHSGKLLRHFAVTTQCQAYHEHNERQVCGRLVERLLAGESIALISDAGTPLISDPGYHLVLAARQGGIRVVPVPGAAAFVAALSVSGLPSDRFVFEGFLPAKEGARLERLQVLAEETRTLIFYESPHRIEASLAAMATAFGGARQAVIARELTKRFETVRGAPLDELCAWLQEYDEQRKGEFVVLVHGAEPQVSAEVDRETERLLGLLLEELPVKQAAALAAKISGHKKNQLYRHALSMDSGRK